MSARYMQLRSLRERAGAAEGPARELDALIGAALQVRPDDEIANGLNLRQSVERFPHDLRGVARGFNLPAYSASLDAAVALVEHSLPDCGWHVIRPRHQVWAAAATIYGRGSPSPMWQESGATPALALLAALLRVLIAREASHD